MSHNGDIKKFRKMTKMIIGPYSVEHFWDSYREFNLTETSFDQSPLWLDAFIQHVVQSSDAVMVCAVAGESPSESAKPLCLLPMWRQNSQRLRRLASLSNFYTTHCALLFSPDADIRVCIATIARGIAAQRRRWDVVDINPLGVETDAYAAILDGFRANGFFVKSYFRFANWHLDVAGRAFEEYWAHVPATLRNTLERKKRKLARESGYRLQIVDNNQDLAIAMADYEQVYAASWKEGESHPQFIRSVLEGFAGAGWLRLGILYIQNVPAAAQIWFVKDKVASIFKLAYDARFEKHSVGSILMQHLMRHVIDADKVRIVDFLSGDEAYKKDWMSHRTECVGVRAYNLRTLRGLLLAAREVAAGVYKRWRA